MRKKRGRYQSRPERYPISVTVEGRRFSGEYYEEGDPSIVTMVSSYGTRSTQRGNSSAEMVAGSMLGQMVQSMRQPGRIREDLRGPEDDGDGDSDQ